jgi:anti-sigma B factor antagonist
MKITQDGNSLNISDVKDLSSANSDSFRHEVCKSLPPSLRTIEVDLSQTRFVDSCGLGALIGVYKTAMRNGDVIVRLVNPSPPLQQMFELTRLHRIFEVVQR